MPTYEMFWDCEYCDTAKLLGKTHRHCPTCGAPQKPESRYFPPEDEKVAVEDHAFVGADRECKSCNTPNSAAADYCTNCGNVLDEAKAIKTKGEVDAGAQSGTRKPAPKPQESEDQGGGGVSAVAAGGGLFGFGCMGLLVAGFLLMTLLCLVNTFWTESAELTVKSHSWSRTIEIEKLKLVDVEEWCDAMPAGAESVSRTQKKRKTRKIKDGETCKTVNVDQGDGTFKTREDCTPKFRDEDVMDAWCSWKQEKWATSATRKANGEGLDSPPKWPEAKVDGCKTRGCTRTGTKTERYVVKLAEADGALQECAMKEPKWKSMAVGSRWTGSKAMLTGNLNCADLAPVK